MKRFFYLAALVLAVIMGFTSCSDDDNNNSSSDQTLNMESVKTAVAVSEGDFTALFNDSDFNQPKKVVENFMVKYLFYKRADAQSYPTAALLRSFLQLKNGDLGAVTSLIDSIKSVAGTYTAVDSTKTWVRMADSLQAPTIGDGTVPGDGPTPQGQAPQGSRMLALNFTNAAGQACNLTINSVFSSGVGDRSDSIVISDSDQTKKILLPKTLSISLTQNKEITFYAKTTFEYDASTQTLSGNVVINMNNGYHLSLYLDLTDNQLNGSATVTKSGKFVIGVTTSMTGTNLIQHVVDHKLYLGINDTKLVINMLDGVSLHIHTTANVATIKSMIKKYYGHTTYTDAEKEEVAAMFNSYIKRSLLVKGKRAATLTFQPRATPTDKSVFGQLDTKVTYVDGQTSLLSELFTAGERNTFVNDITSFIAGYNTLKKLLNLPTE